MRRSGDEGCVITGEVVELDWLEPDGLWKVAATRSAGKAKGGF